MLDNTPNQPSKFRTIAITGEGTDDAAKQTDERNKGLIFKIVYHWLHNTTIPKINQNKQYPNRSCKMSGCCDFYV